MSYKLRVAKVGMNFGICGQVVARNGRVLAETEVFPLGFDAIALNKAAILATTVKR